jgi:hypothetical protein
MIDQQHCFQTVFAWNCEWCHTIATVDRDSEIFQVSPTQQQCCEAGLSRNQWPAKISSAAAALRALQPGDIAATAGQPAGGPGRSLARSSLASSESSDHHGCRWRGPLWLPVTAPAGLRPGAGPPPVRPAARHHAGGAGGGGTAQRESMVGARRERICRRPRPGPRPRARPAPTQARRRRSATQAEKGGVLPGRERDRKGT